MKTNTLLIWLHLWIVDAKFYLVKDWEDRIDSSFFCRGIESYAAIEPSYSGLYELYGPTSGTIAVGSDVQVQLLG